MKKTMIMVLVSVLLNGFTAAASAEEECKTITVRYKSVYVRDFSDQIGNRASLWYTPCGKSSETTYRFRDGSKTVTLDVNRNLSWMRLGPEGSTMNFLNERLSRQNTLIECGESAADNATLILGTPSESRPSSFWNCRIIN